QNLSDLLFFAVPLGFASLGQAAAMLIGETDLSIGPVIALTSVGMAGVMAMADNPATQIRAVAVALGIGLAVGLINGVLVDRVRLVPFIATLATYIMIQGIGLRLLPFPGGNVSNGFEE